MAPPHSRFRWRWFDTLLLLLPPGFLVLLNRHWNRYHAPPRRPSWTWYEYLLFFLPLGFPVAALLKGVRLRLRRPTPGPGRPSAGDRQSPSGSCPHCGSACIDAPLSESPDYLERFGTELISQFNRRYFRTQITGLEKLPEDRPLIILMNHCGMSFPWDFIALVGKLIEAYPDFARYPFRCLGEKVFEQNRFLNFLLPPGWFASLAGVLASYENFEKIMKHRQIVIYAPEGAAGIGKGWARRYQLQPFHTSFLKLAAQYRAKILPVLCLGGENLNPWAWNAKGLARLFKVPYFPVSPLFLATLLFPAMSFWAPPVRLRYEILDPLEVPLDQDRPPAETDWQALAEAFRRQMQDQLDRALSPSKEGNPSDSA